ncbi:MAG: GNAT family N-acetyltransferase [Acidimicrobiales bacterium]
MVSEVRAVTEAELGDYIGCLRTAFLGEREVTAEEVEWKAAHTDLGRTFCAFSDGQLCGTARTFPTDMTVPRGELRASAITEVTVLPTHHRQGHLRAMMQAMLEDARRRGEPVAILTASEWPIYSRFGFGPASERVSIELRTAEVQFDGARAGSVTMVGVHELRSVAPVIYDRIRPATVGALSRDPEWWDSLLNVSVRPGWPAPKNRVRVVWRDDGGLAQGYVVYDTTEIWTDGVPTGEVQVRELFAATPDAYRELWRYLCELDLVAVVRANHRPLDEPLAHLLADGRAVHTKSKIDHLWLRLLDVEKSLATRAYTAPGRVVLEVEDPTMQKTLRLAVEGDPTGGSAQATDQEPDIVLGVTELGAAYMGGVSFATLAMSGRVHERVPGSVARADAMFAIKPLPYLTTNF